MNALGMRKAIGVVLTTCDDGLRMRFAAEGGESFEVTMDWVTVADFIPRVDIFGQEALTMMQIGLDPYSSEHRAQFSKAGFEALDGEAIQ